MATQATYPITKEGLARNRPITVDGETFLRLYDRYLPRVYSYLRQRINDDATCEDLAAATFERALARYEQYSPDRGPFVAWLFGIARNLANEHLRRARRWRWLSLDHARTHLCNVAAPEDSALQADAREQLVSELEHLKPRQRDLLALKFAAGLTNQQIAALTGMSESNVGVVLHRSIRQLRSRMQSEESRHES